jgi:hypothetical protein
MGKENTEELFSIKLNNEGVGHLIKFAKAVKLFSVVAILFIVIALVRDIVLLTGKRVGYTDSFLQFYFNIYPFVSLVFLAIFICQLIFYNKLNSAIQKAINHSDENAFNAAFKNLLQHAYFSIGISVISVLFTFADLIIVLRFRS